MRYATPEWVEKAGAKGYNFTPGQLDENGAFWEPDYNDPVFLEKLDHFLAAMAARYDGNPEVAFIDVGSFGVWGEGHLWASTQMEYPGETIIRHTPMGRFGSPEDLGGALLFLCSEAGAGFVNGAVIPVDGGFNAFSGV